MYLFIYNILIIYIWYEVRLKFDLVYYLYKENFRVLGIYIKHYIIIYIYYEKKNI